MPSEQDIRNQLEQLQLLRENVQFFCRQALAYGGLAAAPVATQRGLASAYAEVARCKTVLREWGVEVEDLPDDVPPPDEPAPARAPAPRSITFHNHASNNGAQGEFYGPVNINHNAPAPPTTSTLTPRQRAELLDRLSLRYRELLDHALAHQVRLQLGLHTRPDAVDPAWRRMLLRGKFTSQPVPPSTPALELFDGQEGQLLVLGAPGAGKTTLIVELAQALTARAQADGQARIPVLLNIAAWRSGQSLRDWLQRALRDVLGASKSFAAQLAGGDDLLLLLDGLDEVAADHRAACVAAISAYLGEPHLAPPLVVGCRSREYADLGTRLPITGAVELEPLELPVIERALEGVPAAAGVLTALQIDELLRELATTPLMVNVLLLAHSGQGVPAVEVQTLEERRRVLWWAYVRHLLVQRKLMRWSNIQVLIWLHWLACLLRKQNETNFLIDDLQPDVLPSARLWWYRWSRGFISGVFLGVLLGVLLGSFGGLTFGLIFGLIGGVLGWLLEGLFEANIVRQEQLRWSWKAYWQSLRRQFVLWMVSWLFLGLSFGLIFHPVEGLIARLFWVLFWGLYFALTAGLIVGLGGGLFDAWTISNLPVRSMPMQGLRTSMKNSLIRALIVGLFVLLVAWFIEMPIFGLFLGLIGLLFIGCCTFIEHHLLRLVLWRAGLFPFRAVTFLEAMSERLLLERDGALYRFRHLLLRDFIADLSDEEIDELARRL